MGSEMCIRDRLWIFRQRNEAIPRTDIALALTRNVGSYSEILRLQCIYEIEHTSVGGDEQLYQIPAIKAGGWEIFSSRN